MSVRFRGSLPPIPDSMRIRVPGRAGEDVQSPWVTPTTTKYHELGEVLRIGERGFMYGLVGATALTLIGGMNTCAAPTAGWQEEVCGHAVAIGDKQVLVDLTTACTANQFVGGYLYYNKVSGVGTMRRILANTASAGSGADTTITVDYPFEAAILATGEASIILQPGTGVIVAATTITSALYGVNCVAMGIGTYGWFQRQGPGPGIAEGTWVVGNSLVPASSTAGYLKPQATDGVLATVGTCFAVAAAGETGAVWYHLPMPDDQPQD